MKKSIIISALALCFAFTNVSATPISKNSKTYDYGFTFQVNPFCVSIAKGDIETVKVLIDLGTNVNEKSNGMTPAMYASKYNRVDILKLLIVHGANLKSKSDKKMTALDYAELHGAEDTAAIIKSELFKKKDK